MICKQTKKKSNKLFVIDGAPRVACEKEEPSRQGKRRSTTRQKCKWNFFYVEYRKEYEESVQDESADVWKSRNSERHGVDKISWRETSHRPVVCWGRTAEDVNNWKGDNVANLVRVMSQIFSLLKRKSSPRHSSLTGQKPFVETTLDVIVSNRERMADDIRRRDTEENKNRIWLKKNKKEKRRSRHHYHANRWL